MFKILLFYFPFALSALILYFAMENRTSQLPSVLWFLPTVFFWVSDFLRQNHQATSELQKEIEELKKQIVELRLNS